jgi:hypothetical protein
VPNLKAVNNDDGRIAGPVVGRTRLPRAGLQDVLAGQKPGDTVPVKVTDTSGVSRTVNVRLGTLTG